MPKDFSLKTYMEASGEAERCPEFIAQLAKKDIIVPDFLKHTLEYSRLFDAQLQRPRDDWNSYQQWRQRHYTERYPGFNSEEVHFAESEFKAPTGEVVTAKRHPRLVKLFHDLCDATGLNNFGPERNQYPRLLLLQSDLQVDRSRFWDETPSVMLSSATFENGSSRMVCATILHELYHILEHHKPTLWTAIKKKWNYRKAMLKEEFGADAFARQFGISGDEIAEIQLQSDHLFMRQQQFARDLDQIMSQHMTAEQYDFLPTFLRRMQSVANAKIRLQDEKDPALCDDMNIRTEHPSTQARIEHVLELEGKELESPEYWRKRLTSKEFGCGSLLGR